MEDVHGKWDKSKGKTARHKDEVPAVKEEVNPDYEEYLMLLQQRNRLLKKLKEKDNLQIQMEKKEQGFSVYVNGANVELGCAPTRAKSRSSSRHSRTAGDAYRERKRLLQHELQRLEHDAGSSEFRVKTAPNESPISRKGWKYDSIQIKTEEGKRRRLKAPGKFTGKYSEDFESIAVDASDSEDENNNAGSDSNDLEDSSGQEDASVDNDDDDEEGFADELALSFNDVETLRKSLEADETIRESIEAAHKRLKDETNKQRETESDDDCDDEIEEEIEEANDSLNLQDAEVLERLPQLTSADGHRPHLGSPRVHHGDRLSAGVGCAVSSGGNDSNIQAANSTTSTTIGKTHLKREKHVLQKDEDLPSSSLGSSLLRKDVQDKMKHQGSKKHGFSLPVAENPGEDLVVLSFSSSSVKRKERVLSATRQKENADNYNQKSDELQDKELTLSSVDGEKKSRPLSATRRNKPADMVDNNAEEIFRAMAKENQTIESRMAGRQTAPERAKSDTYSLPPEVNRPSSISSLPLKSEETIALVTEKVRKMDARQQWYLIDLLAKLECKAPFKAASASTSPRQSPVKATLPFTPVTKPVAAGGLSEQYSTGDSLDTVEDCQSNDARTDVNFEILSNWGNSEYLGLTEIQFFDLEGNPIPYDYRHISISGHVGENGPVGNLANNKTKTTKGRYMWSCQYETGHPVELVFELPFDGAAKAESHGLSKICVWNYNRGIKELNVGVKDVRIFVGGELLWEGVIDKGCGNQVFDYSKVINLVETKLEDEIQVATDPVIRSKTVVLRRSSDADREEVEVGGSETQVKQVQDDKTSIRSETVLLKTSQKVVESTEEVDKDNGSALLQHTQKSMATESTEPKAHQKFPRPPQSPRSHPRSPRTTRRGKERHVEGIHHNDKDTRHTSEQDRLPVSEGTIQALLATDGQGSEPTLVTRCSSTPNLPTCERKDPLSDSIRGNSAAGSLLPSKPPWLESGKKKDRDGTSSRSLSRPKSRPIWLENEMGVADGRRSSHRVEQDFPDVLGSEKPRSRPSSGRRSSAPGGDVTEALPSDFSSKNEYLPTCLDNTPGSPGETSRSGSGRRRHDTIERDTRDIAMQTPTSSHSAQSARAKWRGQQNLSLEESWSLLTLFEKSHRGRITNDLDLKNHDDALDQLLSDRRDEGNSEAVREPIKEAKDRLIDLEIPTLPKGKQLVINIKNTWGDRHYVGLNGIEVFTDTGKPAEIAEITANPPDINILPEYGNDPRVVTNLIDGVYRTRDDMHLWLCPFTPGKTHTITITFLDTSRIAMIRIWNYNKSRIHSFRGVRCIDMNLDGCLVFQGEIARASGTLGADDAFGDTILFTMDENILESMAQYDQTYEVDEEEDDVLMRSYNFERPSTADQGDRGGGEDRPFTSARQHIKRSKQPVAEESADGNNSNSNNYFAGKVLQLNFVSTWGDPYYLGLTGLELLTMDLQSVPLSFSMLKACPRDLNDLPEYGDDDRTLDKLIDGTNVTVSDEHMWMIPFTEGEDHLLTIDLTKNTPLVGLRIWNYNKSKDDSFRGAKQVHVKVDDRIISPAEGFLLRKGPGSIHFDYGQDIYFIKSTKQQVMDANTKTEMAIHRPEHFMSLKKLMPDYEPTLMPCGFVFQFQLFSTWGDPYYIGLNGLEFYDVNGFKIQLSKNNITAYPHSVNILEGVIEDIRTPDKMIDGVNDTNDGRHMWLAPIMPGLINLIYVVFDEPVTVSMVKVWNYSKTPIRGVQQFGLLVDDLLVYHGILPQVPAVTRGILPNLDMPTPHHTILFTDQEQIDIAERKNVLSNRGGEQDIQLTNDKRVVSHFSDPKSTGKAADPALRPMTSVPASKKKR